MGHGIRGVNVVIQCVRIGIFAPMFNTFCRNSKGSNFNSLGKYFGFVL